MQKNPKPIDQITPEEIMKLHGNKFSIVTARRRIKKVITELKLKRNFITMEEYANYYNFPVNQILKAVK